MWAGRGCGCDFKISGPVICGTALPPGFSSSTVYSCSGNCPVATKKQTRPKAKTSTLQSRRQAADGGALCFYASLCAVFFSSCMFCAYCVPCMKPLEARNPATNNHPIHQLGLVRGLPGSES